MRNDRRVWQIAGLDDRRGRTLLPWIDLKRMVGVPLRKAIPASNRLLLQFILESKI
jgi:hypothetical protein